MSLFGPFLVGICPYSLRIKKNPDQKNSGYGHFSRSLRDGGMDLLFLEKCFGSCLKPLFNPTASMTDSHESKLGNGKLHRENVYQKFYITIRRQ